MPGTPLESHWPAGLHTAPDKITQVINDTEVGLAKFHQLIDSEFGGSTPRRSKVHPDADLAAQSQILAWASLDAPGQAREVQHKAFMVGMSHWLDDLVDGRDQQYLLRRWHAAAARCNTAAASGRQEHIRELLQHTLPREFFHDLYRALIEQEPGELNYGCIVAEIDRCASDENMQSLYFGLNRIALGALLFGPQIAESVRADLLDAHNEELIRRCQAGTPGTDQLVACLMAMQSECAVGRVLLGLTTKTTQEIAMSSEEIAMSFPLSMLYSLMFAPLLYFHDIEEEIAQGEMIPLGFLDDQRDKIVYWLTQIRALCEHAEFAAMRGTLRHEQLQMAFLTFQELLPCEIAHALAPVYMRQSVK